MVDRGRSDQRAELHRLVDRYGQLVYRLAFRLLKNQADAEDIAQDVFTKYVQECLDSTIDNPRAWLCVSALNAARNQIRGQQNRRRREDQWAERSQLQQDSAGHNGSSDDSTRSQVWEAVDALPDELRIPIALHYQEGFKYREIAEVTGCPIGTVSARISTAKEQIRTYLNRNGVDSDERNRTSPTGRS